MNPSHQPSLKEVFILVGCQWLLAIGVTVLLSLVQMLFPGVPTSAAGPVGILLGANLYVQIRKKQPELFAPPVRLRWLALYAASVSTFLQGTLLGLAYHFSLLDSVEYMTKSEAAFILPLACSVLWVLSFFGTWSGLRSGHRLVQKITAQVP